ncbi:ATP synthase F1 subcomplex epsilon subunit [Natranaerovirga pectinivora]|uniref:ATP synthase epsilon chain n=1 Tax=Natranaerovirga pectinivora TaxID=682400 RepID=A0A4R3MID5_9FIRM|nr:F0F1 ATP synthase subunit epsilon [Natranaerovirga pectinivora]TCT13084.1 ATP synthase F1 subcomplex epsilon subunit [Natranaerovirga pectinivora]
MADSKFKLHIITPERVFCKEDVEMVMFNTTEGDIGVLKGHIPLTTTLQSGVFKMKIGNEEKRAAVHTGFAEIKPDEVTILADAAEWPEEIDLQRAEQAKTKAENKLKDRRDHIDLLRAEASLRRSVARIEVVKNK